MDSELCHSQLYTIAVFVDMPTTALQEKHTALKCCSILLALIDSLSGMQVILPPLMDVNQAP